MINKINKMIKTYEKRLYEIRKALDIERDNLVNIDDYTNYQDMLNEIIFLSQKIVELKNPNNKINYI